MSHPILLVLAASVWTLALPAPPAPPYALDPLSREELAATTATLSKAGKIHPATRVATIALHEPPKSDVLAAQRGERPAPRVASVMLYDWSTGVTSTGLVDPQRQSIVSWADLPPAEPTLALLLVMRVTEIAQADPRFRTAMARRGYADVSRIRAEPFVNADWSLPKRNGEYVDSAFIVDLDAFDLGRSRHLLTVTIYENLTRGTVDSMRDTAPGPVRASQPPSTPPVASTEHGASRSGTGASVIDIHGSAIQWGPWRLRAGVDPRRGLELYDIGFMDHGIVRSILYRASISETIAPYGDPGFISWYPMDEGDFGLGVAGMTSAVPGEDAPSGAAFLPAVLANDHGKPVEIPRAIAVFERETDVLWRHSGVARRARELVVRGYCTVDNYDYVFDWIFREDGSIQVQATLTGVVNSYDVPDQRDPASASLKPLIFGHLVAPGISAPIHQHFFNYRLDFDIDRPDHNRVMEVTGNGLPAGPDNTIGEWFAAQSRVFRTEQDALRDASLTSWRRWKVVSTRDTNALGQATGYALVPDANAAPYPSPASAPVRRAGFIAHPMWVTPYNPAEMYAAGDVPSHDTTAEGLTRWTAANRSIDDDDVVLWYTLGVTHLPRTEEWPVMPAYTVGFRLVPAGFFSQDPGM